ncbi:MAG TPA: hypothetical protein VNE40_04745 [Candidatus Dormibacteraeota bacterium]|nr:hypothetical protein [Candidatus Dormibacteraeota bacterium]
MRYFFGILVAIGLILLVIVLIISGGNHKPLAQVPVTSYANSTTETRLTIDGPLNDPADHRQIEITVGRDQTIFNILTGYDGSVLSTESYPMTENAYGAFLQALQLLKYNQGNTAPALQDERGYCPLGDRYIFEIVNADGKKIEHFWSTSCGGAATFKGQSSEVVQIFEAQVPSYDQLTADINL